MSLRFKTTPALITGVILAVIVITSVVTVHSLRSNLKHVSVTAEPEPVREKIIVGNGDPSDPCTVEVDADVYPELQKMGIDRWTQACEQAVQAKQ